MRKVIELTILGLLVAGSAPGQAAKNSSPKAAEPKFKAIWEPVPFSKDIQLRAISCTGPETCWVAGAKSTILHTTDGGTA